MNKNNIIDIILPNKRTFSFPLKTSTDIYGSVVINYVNKFKFTNFVICRNSTSDNFYDVLYIDNPNNIISPLIKLPQPFDKTKLTDVLIPNRLITSPHQRIPLYVFYIANFLEMLTIKSMNLQPQQMINNISSSTPIKVQLSTGLVVSLVIDISRSIERISKMVYEEMSSVYKKKRIKDIKEYRFGTYDGYYPSTKNRNKFKDEPLLMEAYRAQQLDKNSPQFLYLQTWSTKQPIDKAIDQFTRELDLLRPIHNEETRILNSTLSIVRREVESKRIARLESNPLLARMRISETEPPLPNFDINEFKINMKVEFKSAKINGKTTALSISVPCHVTASEAIKMLFGRLSKINHANMNNNQGETPVQEEIDDSNVQNKNKKSKSRVSFDQVQIQKDIKSSNSIIANIDDEDNEYQYAENKEDIILFGLISNPTEVPIPPPEDDIDVEIKNSTETSDQNTVVNDNDDEDDNNRNPDDYAFVINGTDEVMAGDIPLLHFISIRQFILKQNIPIIFLLLYKKQHIIDMIRKKELKVNDSLPEIPEEKLARPIIVKKPPKPSFDAMSCCPHCDVQEYFSILIRSIFNVKNIPSSKKEKDNRNNCRTFALSVSLINGTEKVGKTKSTRLVVGTSTILFNETITLDISVSSIPRTARIAFTLYYISSLNKKKKKKPLATYNFPVFTFSGWMNSGKFRKKMWTQKDTDFFLTTCESNEMDPIKIAFQIPKYKYPVFFMNETSFPQDLYGINQKTESLQLDRNLHLTEKRSSVRSNSLMLPSPSSSPTPKSAQQRSQSKRMPSPSSPSSRITPKNQLERISSLVNIDPLTKLTKDDKELLKENIIFCKKYPELLSLFLTTIDYSNPEEVKEIPGILKNWSPLSPELALSLLDAKYADQNVRNYAVERFEQFTDNDIMLYLLQLVQALKYELYDDSPLARFLLRRGLNEPKFLGHQLFWQLMSEAHISHIRQRFSVLLVNFMYGIGSYTDEFLKGYKFTQDLVDLNKRIRKSNLPYGDQMQTVFRNELKMIEIPNEFHLPIDPRIIVDSFIIDKCKVMNSKKKPFFLYFKNASPFETDHPGMLFKVGDDLRQDQLTLQVMKVMEHLWRTNYQDMHMRCYGVLPTGFNQGFIEAVPNSITEAELQARRGTLAGVLEKKLFTDYFQQSNNEKTYEKVIENFRLSSAGYAVSTCVLGIADRHPGNIMVQKDGHYFHIDFGHFLGNFKVKMGYKRENAPFHFSPACAYMLSVKVENGKFEKVDNDNKGDNPIFQLFEQDAAMALNILRHNGKLLITLLMLMVGTGIPELSKPEDIQYMKDKLFLKMTDDEAAAEFKKLIKMSMDSTKTKLNNFFHNLKVNSA